MVNIYDYNVWLHLWLQYMFTIYDYKVYGFNAWLQFVKRNITLHFNFIS